MMSVCQLYSLLEGVLHDTGSTSESRDHREMLLRV